MISTGKGWELRQGECLAMLRSMADDSVDAVITDPPYSSGGFTRDDKNKAPGDKYQQNGLEAKYPTFGGDNRDQRSYLAWCALWISECVRVLRPGGYFMSVALEVSVEVMLDDAARAMAVAPGARGLAADVRAGRIRADAVAPLMVEG